MSKNFDETVRLQFEIGPEWIREVRGERLQQITEDTSSALIWPAHQLCTSLGEAVVWGPNVAYWNWRKEKAVPARSTREVEVKEKIEERAGWRGQSESNRRRREVADLLVLPRPAKSLQNGTDFS